MELTTEAGGVVGGAAAVGAVVGFLAGSIARDLGGSASVEQWVSHGAGWGGLIGLGFFLGELSGR